MTATLATIRTKVRRLTGSPSSNALSDSVIDAAVDAYYLYDMPEQLRLRQSQDIYNFTTEPNIDTYYIDPNTYITVMAPIYVGGQPASFSQSRAQFYGQWPAVAYEETIDTGDGSTTTFTGTLTNTPILKTSVLFSSVTSSDVAMSASDADGDATDLTSEFTSANSGAQLVTVNSFDYVDGTYSVTFATAPGSDEDVIAQYYAYSASQPVSALYFNNSFILRPVPDKAYVVSMEVYKTPTAMASSSDEPLYQELWQLISYGAAMKILEDRGDDVRMAKVGQLLKNAQILVGRRKSKELASQRVPTIYSQGARFNGQYGWGVLGYQQY